MGSSAVPGVGDPTERGLHVRSWASGSPRSVRPALPRSYKLPKSSVAVPYSDSQISFKAVASQRLKQTQVISLKAGVYQQSANKTWSPTLPSSRPAFRSVLPFLSGTNQLPQLPH